PRLGCCRRLGRMRGGGWALLRYHHVTLRRRTRRLSGRPGTVVAAAGARPAAARPRAAPPARRAGRRDPGRGRRGHRPAGRGGALKFLGRRAARVLAPRSVPRRLRPAWLFGCSDIVHRRPWGVVGVIGTWNYPLYLNAGQVAQALVAGNGVLWKPSEYTPRTADVTHRLFLDAGFPAALFAKLPATREAGPLLAEADIDYLVFTGSDAVGRRLAARLGERLVPSTLELSGCDAMFVLDDADVELAAKAAWFGVTLNRGQTCVAVRRILVHRAKYPAFADALRPLAAAAEPLPLLTGGQAEQA